MLTSSKLSADWLQSFDILGVNSSSHTGWSGGFQSKYKILPLEVKFIVRRFLKKKKKRKKEKKLNKCVKHDWCFDGKNMRMNIHSLINCGNKSSRQNSLDSYLITACLYNYWNVFNSIQSRSQSTVVSVNWLRFVQLYFSSLQTFGQLWPSPTVVDLFVDNFESPCIWNIWVMYLIFYKFSH